MNEGYSIMTGLRDQFRNGIDGVSTSYNHRLTRDQVVTGFVNVEEVKRFPLITIGSVSISPNQMTIGSPSWDIPVMIELFGFVRDEDDAFGEALKLYNDMETSLREDPTIGGLVYGMNLSADVSSLDSVGVVFIILRMKYNVEQT